MATYRVFGGVLESSLILPSLQPLSLGSISGEPTWTVSCVDLPAEPHDAVLLGRARVASDAEVTLYATGGGFRLHYDDTGIFDVSADGSQLTFAPGPDPAPGKVEADVLGRVLAVALHAAGRLCLHGSAVAFASGAIAFLAPKHSGKSTLALALTQRGARLLTDDSLPVALRESAVAYPGVHGVRLWDDALGRLAPGAATREGVGGKRVLHDLPPERLETEPRPLLAVYVLGREPPSTVEPVVERRRLPAMLATLAVLREGKIGALLGGSQAPALLERAAELARLVPVYTLRFARDFGQLDAVVAALASWSASDVAERLETP